MGVSRTLFATLNLFNSPVALLTAVFIPRVMGEQPLALFFLTYKLQIGLVIATILLVVGYSGQAIGTPLLTATG